jgi:hypothetical protein
MKTLFFLTAALLAATSAHAASLKGTYSFVGTDTCLLTDSSGAQILGTINGTAQGFAVFNGDGTGTINVKNDWLYTAITTYPSSFYGNITDLAPVMTTHTADIPITYTVTGDEFTITQGSDIGQWQNALLTIINAPPVSGTISNNSPPVLLTATATQATEQWIWDICANCVWRWVTCLRTRTLTKVNAAN